MSRYVTIRLTKAQAKAACNASDLIADSFDADYRRREASLYARTSAAIAAALATQEPTRG